VAAVAPALDARTAAVVARRAPFHIPSLDGLRAVSFLTVFVAHAGADQVPGGFGVTVFFFLSGYLITTLLRIEGGKTGHYSLKNFYLRRALRILPPFYLVLAGAVLLSETHLLRTEAPLRTGAVASQLLHLSNYWIASHGWVGMPAGTGVYWSLAVEEHFYLLFPALFVVFSRNRITGRSMAWVFWGLCAVVLVWRCILVWGFHSPPDRTYVCSDTRIDSILFGCALAVWNNPVLDPVAGSAFESPMLLRALAALGFAVLVVTFVVRDGGFRETVRYSLQGLALTPLFVAAIRWPRSPVFAALNWKPTRFLGTLSYSLYLVHQSALALFEQHTHIAPLPRALAALVVSFTTAWVIYVLVEKPCARLRRRLSAAD
jgi:peptidoglycan/LPS O-acetylase OafA/YrhL